MAERNSGGGSFPINLNTVLALLALGGSVWFVSNRLTSTRPAASAGGLPDFVGDQILESRLWEDPFKVTGKSGVFDRTETELSALVTQLFRRVAESNEVLILPVMLPGGTYSEDRESRIRSRFAVESALGQSGFAPEDAEHIGWVKVPWPTTAGIPDLKTNLNECPGKALGCALEGGPGISTNRPLELRFEWHRPKVFYAGAAESSKPEILVLWMDNSFFDDEPLLRLPLLLAPIMEAAGRSNSLARVALIGPRSSSTLRGMLPKWGASRPGLSEDFPCLWSKLTNIFRRIDIYSATASAMDETFVRTNAEGTPRTSVGSALTSIGFKSFHNFAATDDQLAGEILAELSLRGAGLADTNNHIVMISEWDTFYARMLSLTYAAELAIIQGKSSNRFAFIEGYLHRTNPMPANFHPFVYLRGLDGQTVGGGAESAGGEGKAKSGPGSFDELRNWTPDANKAEGPAQFDYLSRLGERIATLQDRLYLGNRGRIKAIGVVGSDVYDTLLILQALRPQFPEVLFFTTDLDARYWHPREQAWSRNVILASGYDLRLSRRLQREVPPFRDSAQTAQFAATLAALGDKNLLTPTRIQPRRFEIGRYGPVNLRLDRRTNPMSSEVQLHSEPPQRISLERILGICIVGPITILLATFLVRPLRRSTWEAPQFQAEALLYVEEDLGGADGAEALVAGLHTWAEQRRDPLAASLLEMLTSGPKPAAGEHDTTFSAKGWHQALRVASGELKIAKTHEQEQAAGREVEACRQKLLRCLLGGLNKLLRRDLRADVEHVRKTALLSSELKAAYTCWQAGSAGPSHDPRQMLKGRAILDDLLNTLGKEEVEVSKADVSEPTTVPADILAKARESREAGLKLYDLRRCWVRHSRMVLIMAFVLGLALVGQIWEQDAISTTGEPFSLITGTSIWPAEILRLIAFFLAVGFIIQSQQSLRSAGFALTRRFRLPLASGEPDGGGKELAQSLSELRGPAGRRPFTKPGELLQDLRRLPAALAGLYEIYHRYIGLPDRHEHGAVVASRISGTYRELGGFRRRLIRIFLPALLFVIFCFGLYLVGGEITTQPLRGMAARWWHNVIIGGAMFGFLLLTFIAMDAALLCRWFIRQICEAPTEYPLATSNYFSQQRGNLDRHYLDEWIDLQLIADLTERVSKLVYYPSIVFFVMLVARNEWWDHWNWPWSLTAIYALNLVLAAACVVILQNAARKAKADAEIRLEAKVKQLQSTTAQSAASNNASQAEKLLEEMRSLRRGAFVPFWESPVLGALLLPSGGTAFLQMIVWFMGR